MFINQDLVQKHALDTTLLAQPIPVHNVDRTLNEHGAITEEVEVILCYGEHSERVHLAIVDLGHQALIVGYPWLLWHNPKVDWAGHKVNMS